MTWFDNPGRPPSKWPADTQVIVRWAGGGESLRPYGIGQLVWEKRGWLHDISEFRRA